MFCLLLYSGYKDSCYLVLQVLLPVSAAANFYYLVFTLFSSSFVGMNTFPLSCLTDLFFIYIICFMDSSISFG